MSAASRKRISEMMKQRWAERKKFKVEVIEETAGDEAGLKSGTLLIKGHNAYGWAKTDIGWGHQIRSYVLQPYQLVKDLRTGHTSGTPDDVLDGELDDFMQSSLAQRVHGGGPAQVEDVE